MEEQSDIYSSAFALIFDKMDFMATTYNFFQKAPARKVHSIIADILTQRTEFTGLVGQCVQLGPSTSWLLTALEAQHQKRTGKPVDLSKDPLLLILELTAYYFAQKGPTLVTSKDGFVGELEGASRGAPLIMAYATWVKTHGACLTNDNTLRLRDPVDLGELLNEFKLNDAAALATRLGDTSRRLSS